MTLAMITKKKLWMAVLWPCFVCTGAFSGILFAFIDPLSITHHLGFLQSSRLEGYSITFLVMWAFSICAAICSLRAAMVVIKS